MRYIIPGMKYNFAALCLLVLALAGCGQSSGCDLVKVAQLPIEFRSRLFIVPVTVNGHAISMLLDTGGEKSLLGEAAVQRLGVTRDGRTYTVLAGLAGGSIRTDANIDSMQLGGVPVSVDRMSVDSLVGYPGIDGILGLDILRDFDLDIDAPNHALTLYRVRRCERADPPWNEPATPIAVSTLRGWMDMPFEINGIAETAVVDTGATNTTITPRMVRRLGLSEQDLANDRIVKLHVVSGDDTQARVHRFQTIQIGPITMHNADIIVLAKDPPSLGGGRQFREAVIGQDFLGNRRVWLSFKTDRLYISRKSNDAAAGE
ncbi:MAG TPA: retroviral-like aspartic protease family protein [Acetobacteraceae bacterium]|jgi:predicted aspartyl protease|nr:retroviral-like aspartic protease family protein [Acetobacteraceae bacterium]